MLDLSAIGYTVFAYLSTEKISYKFTPAVEKTNSKGEKTYTAIRNMPEQEIAIKWHDDTNGQHLTLWLDSALSATFSLTNDKKMLWQPQDIYSVDADLTAKPSNPKNVAIVSTSLYDFFQTWLNTKPFAQYLNSLSREQVYPPSLVKLLLLFISYLNVRTKTSRALGGKLTADLDSNIDNNQVAKIFNILLAQVVGDTPHMIRMYSDSSTYLLPAGTIPTTEKVEIAPTELVIASTVKEPQEVTLTPIVEVTEESELIEVAELHNPDDVDLTNIMAAVKNIK